MPQISTNLLNLYRNDWAKADTVAGMVEGLMLWDKLRDVDPSQKIVYIKSNTGLGYADVVNEGTANPAKTPAERAQLTLTQKRRGISYSHTVEAREFDPYGKVSDMAEEARKAIRRRMKKDSADLFLNNAFSSSHAIATGSALFADSHTVGPGQTLDNLASAAALSESVVATMLTSLRSQRGPKNEPMAYGGQVDLVVPPALEFTALKIAQSSLVPGTPNNDKNVVGSRINVVVETEAINSTTAFCLLASDKNELGCYRAVKVALANGSDADAHGNVEMAKWAIYAIGIQDPFNMVGNAGA